MDANWSVVEVPQLDSVTIGQGEIIVIMIPLSHIVYL